MMLLRRAALCSALSAPRAYAVELDDEFELRMERERRGPPAGGRPLVEDGAVSLRFKMEAPLPSFWNDLYPGDSDIP